MRQLGNIERIERMIMAAEARRNAALREIDRHRATLGRRLRQAVREAEAEEVAFAQETRGMTRAHTFDKLNDRPDQATRRRRGPRTPSGQARTAHNAMRHGLSLPVLADPATAAVVESLTRQITQDAPRRCRNRRPCALVAQAQVELIRVRRARRDLLAAALIHLAKPRTRGGRDSPLQAPPLSRIWRYGCPRWIATNGARFRAASSPSGSSMRRAGPSFWQNQIEFHNENNKCANHLVREPRNQQTRCHPMPSKSRAEKSAGV